MRLFTLVGFFLLFLRGEIGQVGQCSELFCLLQFALFAPLCFVPGGERGIGGGEFFRQCAKKGLCDGLVGIKLLGGIPIVIPRWVTGCQLYVPKEQVCLENVLTLFEDILTHGGGHLFVVVAPQRFDKTHPCIKSVRIFGDNTAEFLDGLGQHVPLGIETRQPWPTESKLGIFFAPCIGVDVE